MMRKKRQTTDFILKVGKMTASLSRTMHCVLTADGSQPPPCGSAVEADAAPDRDLSLESPHNDRLTKSVQYFATDGTQNKSMQFMANPMEKF